MTFSLCIHRLYIDSNVPICVLYELFHFPLRRINRGDPPVEKCDGDLGDFWGPTGQHVS